MLSRPPRLRSSINPALVSSPKFQTFLPHLLSFDHLLLSIHLFRRRRQFDGFRRPTVPPSGVPLPPYRRGAGAALPLPAVRRAGRPGAHHRRRRPIQARPMAAARSMILTSPKPLPLRDGALRGEGVVFLLAARPEVPQRLSAQPRRRHGLLEGHRRRQAHRLPSGGGHQEGPRLLRRQAAQGREDQLDHARVPPRRRRPLRPQEERHAPLRRLGAVSDLPQEGGGGEAGEACSHAGDREEACVGGGEGDEEAAAGAKEGDGGCQLGDAAAGDRDDLLRLVRVTAAAAGRVEQLRPRAVAIAGVRLRAGGGERAPMAVGLRRSQLGAVRLRPRAHRRRGRRHRRRTIRALVAAGGPHVPRYLLPGPLRSSPKTVLNRKKKTLCAIKHAH